MLLLVPVYDVSSNITDRTIFDISNTTNATSEQVLITIWYFQTFSYNAPFK